MTLFLKVSELVFNLHTDHFDFCDDSYILHIMNVVNKIPKEYRTEDIEILALLHDTIWYHANKIEKLYNKEPYEYLKSIGVNDHILNGLKLVTREPNESFDNQIERIISSHHKDAIIVKIADIDDDTSSDRINKVFRPKEREKIMKRAEIHALPAVEKLYRGLFMLNKKEKYDSIFTKHKEKYQKIQDMSDRYGEEIDKAILEYTKKESEYKKYYETHDKAFFDTVPIIPMNLFEKLFSMDNPELKPLWDDVVVQLEKTLNLKIEFIKIDVTFLSDKVKNGSEMSTVLTLNSEKVASLHIHVAMINHYLYVRMSHVLYDLLKTSDEFQSTWNKCMTILKLLEPDFFNL